MPLNMGHCRTTQAKFGSRWLGDRTSSPPHLLLRWQENGGPPVSHPSRKGFGSRLIERSLAQDLDAKVRIEYAATGLLCTVEAPLPS